MVSPSCRGVLRGDQSGRTSLIGEIATLGLLSQSALGIRYPKHTGRPTFIALGVRKGLKPQHDRIIVPLRGDLDSRHDLKVLELNLPTKENAVKLPQAFK